MEYHPPLKSDSGVSSSSIDTLSSTVSSLVLNSSADFLLQEKIIYLGQVIKNIESAKEIFWETYQEKKRQIKSEIMKMHYAAKMRKAELDNQLQQIASDRISSWDQQLKMCEEVKHRLKNIGYGSSPSIENILVTCNRYGKSIGIINSGEVSFSCDEAAMNYFLTFERSNLMTIMPKLCFEIEGQIAAEHNRPWGVCTDITGRILIADRGRNRIQIFNESGKFLFDFGKTGNRAREFNKPTGITVDIKRRIIVTDKDNHRVQVFTYSGRFIFMFGRRGSKQGQFSYPWGVDTNLEGDIVVGDSKNHRVQLFTKNGMFLSEFVFNRQILRLDESICPLGVAFKPDGTVLVTDLNNGIIFKINDEFSTAVKLENCMMLTKPQGIACNSNGVFMVADGVHSKIQVFDIQEKPYRVFGMAGNNLGEFDKPQGICFHPKGDIVVGDFGNNRIQVFDFPL